MTPESSGGTQESSNILDSLPDDDPRLIEHMRSVSANLCRGNVRLRLGLIATEEDVEHDREIVRRIKFL